MVSVVVSVLDANTGRPIQGAFVSLGGVSAVTNSNGVAVLDVPAGSYVVRASKSGYRMAEYSLSVSTSVNVRIPLIPAMRLL